MEQPERYVALGDSMSIDRYPSLDLTARGVAPSSLLAEGHERGARADLPVGAASLLVRNVGAGWQEMPAPTGSRTVYTMWGRAANAIYATAFVHDKLFFNGTSWIRVTSTFPSDTPVDYVGQSGVTGMWGLADGSLFYIDGGVFRRGSR